MKSNLNYYWPKRTASLECEKNFDDVESATPKKVAVLRMRCKECGGILEVSAGPPFCPECWEAKLTERNFLTVLKTKLEAA